ncbi:hypothetical protein GCM10022207_61810 [Streptomyces lannensis]|uniref:Uncharacterized protein n=1 Tax=Streptomyces lannensis TaxID=766498 RepID=A0ABP7KSG1_9ACTN
MLTCWDAALWETCWDMVARPCALLVGAGQGQDWGGVDLALDGADTRAGDDGRPELGGVHGVQSPAGHGPAARTGVGLGGRGGDDDGTPYGAALRHEHHSVGS